MYIVSACLAGVKCRYDGNAFVNEKVQKLFQDGKAIPLCPEILGGLSIPRQCCEIIKNKNGEDRIYNKSGEDVTNFFIEGAKKTLETCKCLGIKKAILKSKSPSCGYGIIYDGSFSGNLTVGKGFTARLLESEGIEIITEESLDNI